MDESPVASAGPDFPFRVNSRLRPPHRAKSVCRPMGVAKTDRFGGRIVAYINRLIRNTIKHIGTLFS